MALHTPPQIHPGETTILNAGTTFTGDYLDPVSQARSIRFENGVITEISSENLSPRGRVIDVHGMTVAPGLIDSHSHVAFGDYTPRQDAVGFLAKYVHGAVAQVVSAGEIHVPNRPRDPDGIKALAKLAKASWDGHRPGGMKVNGGVILLGPGLTRADMHELAEYGVGLAKYGFAVYDDLDQAAQDVRNAQEVGIVVTAHSGGPTAADGVTVDTDVLHRLLPDVAGHANGGPTSLDDAAMQRIIEETHITLQLVQAGNLRSSLMILKSIVAQEAYDRIVLGTDTPTGTGVMPLGALKTVAELSSLAELPPALVWAWGSGRVAEVYKLVGGHIRVGEPADIAVIDAPYGSVATDAEGALRRGDVPAVAMAMTDGTVHAYPSNFSPRARQLPTIQE